MLLHTAWYIYCPWVSATISHLTCAVSDLLPLLPDLSSHSLQIPGISFILRCVLDVGCDNISDLEYSPKNHVRSGLPRVRLRENLETSVKRDPYVSSSHKAHPTTHSACDIHKVYTQVLSSFQNSNAYSNQCVLDMKYLITWNVPHRKAET